MNTSTPGVETLLTQAVEIFVSAEGRAFVEQACTRDESANRSSRRTDD
jgi:hypothetical protein